MLSVAFSFYVRLWNFNSAHNWLCLCMRHSFFDLEQSWIRLCVNGCLLFFSSIKCMSWAKVGLKICVQFIYWYAVIFLFCAPQTKMAAIVCIGILPLRISPRARAFFSFHFYFLLFTHTHAHSFSMTINQSVHLHDHRSSDDWDVRIWQSIAK